MLQRITSAINLFRLRTIERIQALTPAARRILFVAVMAVLALAFYFDLLPHDHTRNHPYALVGRY